MTPTALHTWRARCGFPTWEAAAAVLGTCTGPALEGWATGATPAPVWLWRALEVAEVRQIRAELAIGLTDLRAWAETAGVADEPAVKASLEAAEAAVREICP